MAHDVASKTRMKAFISHARPDAAFAEQLGSFLGDNGFRTLREGSDLGPDRGDLIHEADAIIYVLTPGSAKSETCAWDLAEAQRLGKRVIAVLPGPINGAAPPIGSSEFDYIYFYSDPAVPHSGFFDGQKRLAAALHPNLRSEAAERELRDARRAAARQHKEDKKREREDRKLARRLAEAQMQEHFPQRPRVRFPTLRATVLGVFAAAVLAVVLVPGMPDRVRGALSGASSVVSTLAAEEEPYSPNSVPAEDFTPDRDLIAGRGGANVRDYPLTSGTLLANAPQGTRLRVTGRLEVQGQWWFRVVMADGRVGFVREDVVRWDTPRSTSTPAANAAATNVVAIEPAVQIAAGRAGANLRTRPTRSGRALVRLPAGAEMNATGKVRQGGHWWVRVALEDGREGFVRDDVLTVESRHALQL